MTGYQPIVIPFNYPGKNMVDRRGIEPRLKRCKRPVLPLSLSAHCLVAGPGIEPRSGAYETPELPLLYPAIDWLQRQGSNLRPID